jgi:hypothetical protein
MSVTIRHSQRFAICQFAFGFGCHNSITLPFHNAVNNTMLSVRIAIIAALFAAASAFQTVPPVLTASKVRSHGYPTCKGSHSVRMPWLIASPCIVNPQASVPYNTARYVILTEEETASILQSASDCAEGECSIDDVAELIFELKEQRKEMQTRLDRAMNMIADLERINAKEERKTDEVRAFVKDMLRVFSTDKPMVFPTGYSGDVGGGPTTAYDALPPKKWVPEGKK